MSSAPGTGIDADAKIGDKPASSIQAVDRRNSLRVKIRALNLPREAGGVPLLPQFQKHQDSAGKAERGHYYAQGDFGPIPE
jgi:hypothetical protein